MVDQPSEETESLEREWPNTYAAYFYRLDPLEAETWEHELVSGRNKLKPPPTDSEVRDAISYIAAQGPARGPKLKSIIESIRMLRDRPELNIERESCLACSGNGYLAFPVSENPEDKKDWRFGISYSIENKWRSNGYTLFCVCNNGRWRSIMDNQSVSEKTKRFANSALSWMMSLDPDPTHPDANWCLRLRDHHDEEAMAAKLTHAYSLQKSKG